MNMRKMQGFAGFPAGKVRQTKIPDPFFTELLPIIDDLAELKLTLYCFWQLGRQQGDLRYLRRSDLERDEQLAEALTGVKGTSTTSLADAIDRAVARGTLLRVYVQVDDRPAEEWLFMNTAHSRELVSRIQAGEITEFAAQVPAETATRLRAARPNIFNLYEQNIGVLQPLIADELRDAERRYPPEWIEEAFREAVRLNKRSWRYVLAILERWAAEGKGDEVAERDSPEARRRRYIPDKYADLIEH